jgi:hypothetical protein
MKKFFRFSLPLFLLIAPVFAFAQTIISPTIPGMTSAATTSTSPGAFVAGFYQFALMIGGVLAFGAVVYGGILYAASAGNPSKQSEGKEWIKSALFGLLLLAGAYLILYTINPNLVNLGLPTLQSVNIAAPSGGINLGATNPGGVISGNQKIGATSFSPGVTGSATENAISVGAIAYYGTNTSSGPGNGTVACAWAVNNVLTQAGIAPLDSNSVQSMENALTSGRGTLVNSSAAVAGDIVIEGNDGHVGICMNDGCTQVLSNSSSNASFSWKSGTNFSGTGGTSRIYQVSH